MGKVFVLFVVALWTILSFFGQGVLQAWSWMIIASVIFTIIALCFVFLGFCARQRERWPFFTGAGFSLILSTASMFIGHEEYKDFLGRAQAEMEAQEKIDLILLGRG